MQKPVQKAMQKPTQKAAQKPAQKAAQKPAQKAVQKPAQKAAQKPVQKVAQKSTQKAGQKPLQKSAQKTAQRPKKGNPNLRLVKNGEKTVKMGMEDQKAAAKTKTLSTAKADYGWKEAARPTARTGNVREPGEWFRQHKSLVLAGVTLLTLAAVIGAVYYYVITTYTVTTVYVDGNVHYTNEEVMDMVMKGRYGNNSLYLAVKYKDKGVEGVPFVEKMDVNILSPDTIRINVYEKALAGYVEYLGRYMYFDREGIVVESSEMRTSGIPQVTGLKFDYVVLNEPLPIENSQIFAKILSITQLLEKYELSADKIFFDSAFDLTLYFGEVRVTLGASDEIDGKIMRLQYILPRLEGKKGTLQMENYTEDTKNITFNQE